MSVMLLQYHDVALCPMGDSVNEERSQVSVCFPFTELGCVWTPYFFQRAQKRQLVDFGLASQTAPLMWCVDNQKNRDLFFKVVSKRRGHSRHMYWILSLWFIMQQVTACTKEAQPPDTATMIQNKCTNESSQQHQAFHTVMFTVRLFPLRLQTSRFIKPFHRNTVHRTASWEMIRTKTHRK